MEVSVRTTVWMSLVLAVWVRAQAPPRAQFQTACRNVAQIEQAGTEPLGQYLQSVVALQNPHQVALAVGELHRFGAFAAFAVGNEPVPDRQRDFATQQYAEKLFTLLGDPPAQAAEEARTAINMEVSLTPAPGAAPPQPLHLAELQRLAPNFDWHAYWGTLGAPEDGTITVSPDVMRQLNGRILLATMEQWKSYLRWCWLRATAVLLPAPFVAAHYAFTTGKQSPARAAQCAAAASAYPARAYADVPLTSNDFFSDALHLRAWKARQHWLPAASSSGGMEPMAMVHSTSARTRTPARGR